MFVIDVKWIMLDGMILIIERLAWYWSLRGLTFDLSGCRSDYLFYLTSQISIYPLTMIVCPVDEDFSGSPQNSRFTKQIISVFIDIENSLVHKIHILTIIIQQIIIQIRAQYEINQCTMITLYMCFVYPSYLWLTKYHKFYIVDQ